MEMLLQVALNLALLLLRRCRRASLIIFPFFFAWLQKLASTSIDADARVDAVRQQLQVQSHSFDSSALCAYVLFRFYSSLLPLLQRGLANGGGGRFCTAKPCSTAHRRRLQPLNSRMHRDFSGWSRDTRQLRRLPRSSCFYDLQVVGRIAAGRAVD